MPSPGTAPVAVILTCYNEGPYVGRAVETILGQTVADRIAEIVIADDGSRPDTIAILQELEERDNRIRVLYGAGGAGQAAQRNLAISNTASPFVAILDGDDFWVETKLAAQLAVIERDEAIGLVYTDFFTFPNDDEAAARRANIPDLSGADDLATAYFLNDPPILPSTVLLRRAAFDDVSGFDTKIRVFEETDFYFRLARRWTFGFVATPLIYKRFRDASITGGRKDLLSHHAFVAFKAAAENPALLPLVTKRLSERARRLGNHRFVLGDRDSARVHLGLALRLHPFNLKALASYLAMTFAPRLAERMVRDRKASLGSTAPSEN